MRLILASASPARRDLLLRAGLDPEVVPSGVDEDEVQADSPQELTRLLARLKAESVESQLCPAQPVIILGCDSVLEFDGLAHGKPSSPLAAQELWSTFRGRWGVLHTGHHVIVVDASGRRSADQVGSTRVRFDDLSDREILGYVATGEPQRVAGGFALEGLGGAYVSEIAGDPHNVTGVSLPLLRQMFTDLGICWQGMWRPELRLSAPGAEQVLIPPPRM